MAQFNITISGELLHGLFLSKGKDEAFAKLMEEIFNQVPMAQYTEQLRAESYERTEERTVYRNGVRDRSITIRVYILTLSSKTSKWPLQHRAVFPVPTQ